MRRVGFFISLIWLLLAPPALAAEEPSFAPPPEWVEPVEIPEPDPERAAQPLQPLLVNSQVRYGETDEFFSEGATLIQTPAGLAMAGTITIPWQPDQSDLIVHRLHILRDGEIIDPIAAGQRFTVLRRENNLENATLDGVLTAVIQPEGLAVGDILVLSYTTRERPAAIDFGSESALHVGHGGSVRLLHSRQIWPADLPMRWRASEWLAEHAELRETSGGSELVLTLADAEGPEPVADAPPRFRLPETIEASEYASWAEVAALLAPLYEEARRPAPDSPLRAEIARIAEATADPRDRAMRALRLAQDQVRYVALGMGDAGYVPASADQTWSRRFGDCKGKTALLLALLDGLGVEAEPVLVSSFWGDGLDERLPQMQVFDHVIVRARIDGQSYWLDGTRQGDRDIEALRSSPFGWGLPIRAAGAALEPLPVIAPRLPLVEVAIDYDASVGFDRRVPFEGSVLLRSDSATLFRAAAPQATEQQLRAALGSFGLGLPEDSEIESLSASGDDEAGTFTFGFSGEADMDWPYAPAARAPRYEFVDNVIDWDPDFEREAEEEAEIPFALAFPVHIAMRETILLPNDGAGFTIDGEDIDATLAQTEIRRSTRIEGGRAISSTSFRRLATETEAAAARADLAAIEEIRRNEAHVRAPDGYEMSESERKAIIDEQPADVGGFIERGFLLMGEGRTEAALADFDRAIALEPASARAHANRGVALIHLDRLDESEAALDRAALLDDSDFVVDQGYGMLRLAQHRPAEAVEALTRSLGLDPSNAFTLGLRADAHARLGQFERAREDIRALLELGPGNRAAIQLDARLSALLGDQFSALAAADRLIALEPNAAFRRAYRGELLQRFGKEEEASEEYARAFTMTGARPAEGLLDDLGPITVGSSILAADGQNVRAIALITSALDQHSENVQLLSLRCWTRMTANIELEQALADCDEALRLDPENAAVIDSRGWVKLRLGRLEEAIADFEAALALEPDMSNALYGRGIARLRSGDAALGGEDIAAARRIYFDIDSVFGLYGISAETAAND